MNSEDDVMLNDANDDDINAKIQSESLGKILSGQSSSRGLQLLNGQVNQNQSNVMPLAKTKSCQFNQWEWKT